MIPMRAAMSVSQLQYTVAKPTAAPSRRARSTARLRAPGRRSRRARSRARPRPAERPRRSRSRPRSSGSRSARSAPVTLTSDTVSETRPGSTEQRMSSPTVRPGGRLASSRSSASSTPGTNASRENVSCRIVSSWPSPPNSTSWCATRPGRRTEWIAGSPPISSAVALAVPGRRVLLRLVVQLHDLCAWHVLGGLLARSASSVPRRARSSARESTPRRVPEPARRPAPGRSPSCRSHTGRRARAPRPRSPRPRPER